MLNTASVVITFDNDEMPEGTQKGVAKLLDAELKRCGFTGIWRVAPIHRSKGGRKPFAANRLSKTRGGENSIKIVTMLRGPDNAWESDLIPPSDYGLDDVLAALGGTNNVKVIPSVAEEDHVPEPVVKASNAAQLEIGTVFQGKVSSVQSYGAFIDLCDDVTGLCHKSEWDNNFVNDMNRVAKVGQSVNVMLTKIKEDGKLELSRRSAIGCPVDAIINAAEEIQKFKGTLNAHGKLIIRGFVAELDNVLWLLHTLAKVYNDKSVVSQANMSPSGVRYVPDTGKKLAGAMCVRFNAKALASSSGPLVAALRNKGWVEAITVIETKRRKKKEVKEVVTIGYRITDLGWEEAGGHLKYVSGDKTSRCFTNGGHDTDDIEPVRSESKPVEEPESMVTEPLNMLAGDESSTDGIDMDLLREYKQKVVRMSDIELELKPHDDIVLLVMEKMEIEEWMARHPDANKHYLAVHSRLKEIAEEKVTAERERAEQDAARELECAELQELMGDGSN